jgi:hypothetical protein
MGASERPCLPDGHLRERPLPLAPRQRQSERLLGLVRQLDDDAGVRPAREGRAQCDPAAVLVHGALRRQRAEDLDHQRGSRNVEARVDVGRDGQNRPPRDVDNAW